MHACTNAGCDFLCQHPGCAQHPPVGYLWCKQHRRSLERKWAARGAGTVVPRRLRKDAVPPKAA